MDASIGGPGLRRRVVKQEIGVLKTQWTQCLSAVGVQAFCDTRLDAECGSASSSSATGQSQDADGVQAFCDTRLDAERGSASLSSATGQSQNADDSSSNRKSVFLSYNSAQRSFAESLYEEIKNAGYSPFFDQDRDSLPKGEGFAEKIFEAAKNCRVAVLVLSESYFCNKWPMLELEQFVKAQSGSNPTLKILPLFYGCDASSLKAEETKERLRQRWEEIASQDLQRRIDVNNWEEAFNKVFSNNGLALLGRPEVEYREEVLDSLFELCPPDLMKFQLPPMKGGPRLCKVVADKLINASAKGETAVLGLHGVGGMGKSLLCKALCNYFLARFDGRVLYVDFTDGNSLELKKKIVRELTNFSLVEHNRRPLDSMDELQVDYLLTMFLRQQHVFLAIDNFSDALKLPMGVLWPLSKGSMLLVTSRSNKCFTALQDMHILETNMPTLEEEEAIDILVSAALLAMPPSPSERMKFEPIPPVKLQRTLSKTEYEVLQTCVSRCVFRDNTPLLIKLQSPASRNYHPMALEALGRYLPRATGTLDPLEWERRGEIPNQVNLESAAKLDSIYYLFEKVYDNKKRGRTMMDACDRLIFMDVAIFAPRETLWNLNCLLAWLDNVVDDISIGGIEDKVKKLEVLGYLEIEAGSNVKLHDVYKDFAYWKLRQLQLDKERPSRWCLHHSDAKGKLPSWLKVAPPNGFWPDLQRIMLQTSRKFDSTEYLIHGNHEVLENLAFFKIPQEMIREWRNVKVLHLAFGGERIDIGPLKCLRDLRLEADQHLKAFDCSGELQELRFMKFICSEGEVRQVLQHADFKAPLLECLEMNFNLVDLDRPLTLPLQCHQLTILKVSNWHTAHHHEELDFQHFPNLIDLEIVSLNISELFGPCTLSLVGLSALTKLKRMYFRALPFRGPFLGLENLISLEILVLRLCGHVTALPGLSVLTNLQHLSVSGTEVHHLTGLDKLSELRELYCLQCGRLQALPDLSSLQHLSIVITHGCDLLDPNISVPASCSVPNWGLASTREVLIAGGSTEAMNQIMIDDALKAVNSMYTPVVAQEMKAELENLVRVLMDPRTKARADSRIQRIVAGHKLFQRVLTLLKLLAYVVGCLAAEYLYEMSPIGNIILPWFGVEGWRSVEVLGTDDSVFSSWRNFGCFILFIPVIRIIYGK